MTAVLQRCFVKKVFLKILQYSQENTNARVFFNKVAGLIKTCLAVVLSYRNDVGLYFALVLLLNFFKLTD